MLSDSVQRCVHNPSGIQPNFTKMLWSPLIGYNEVMKHPTVLQSVQDVWHWCAYHVQYDARTFEWAWDRGTGQQPGEQRQQSRPLDVSNGAYVMSAMLQLRHVEDRMQSCNSC